MLCRKFELILIKIGFFYKFLKVLQNWAKVPVLYYSWSLAKFHQKWQGENSPFLLHFLMHIHVLMLCRKFKLILMEIGFFMNF